MALYDINHNNTEILPFCLNKALFFNTTSSEAEAKEKPNKIRRFGIQGKLHHRFE